uniref:Microsomal glutathione S-transferase 1 n=1 Tax=Lissorhoptrus oryzophilus TaxID=308863 RepID=A0A2R4FXI2_9CUCU|nr:microsomal glutathione S-transferase 3 [Lissorhoptrus oryzophilus]
MVVTNTTNGTNMMDQTGHFNEVLSLTNHKFATYLVVSSLLILKMMALTILTIQQRFKHKVVISEEDAKANGGTVGNHPDVDRVRRAFQNDLENIPAFLIISLAYLFVNPPGWVVHILYYLFLLVRIGHTIVYAVYIVRQPARGICFFIGFLIIMYMSLHVLFYGLISGYGKKSHKM